MKIVITLLLWIMWVVFLVPALSLSVVFIFAKFFGVGYSDWGLGAAPLFLGCLIISIIIGIIIAWKFYLVYRTPQWINYKWLLYFLLPMVGIFIVLII